MEASYSPSMLVIILGWISIAVLIGAFFLMLHRGRKSALTGDYLVEQLKIEREARESRREINRLMADLAAKLDR